ncbi:MAG: sigma-70 family RNA polymerase sigma factor [Gemmatimonadetes bacterium]|nr:sigma-70 family RNA polymerase sigma factor [Gemmatimonadota bacterium]MCY3942186.1 sigma-70 family RNA polymerase sigma factor [Gemmatimonadota bacterium]
MTGTPPDSALAQEAAEGRESAFRELLERYERPVFALVYRMVRERDLAEDLAQDAFIRAFRGIGTYKPEYKFSSWIFKIAHNVTIDHLRRRRLDTISMEGSRYARTEEERERSRPVVASSDESPAEHLENQELRGEIEEAIGNLRPHYRTVILLRHVEGRSYQEIAEITDLPLGTVKTYIHRARVELRELLQDVWEDR